MVLDLRLVKDWLSGDNQFFFCLLRTYPADIHIYVSTQFFEDAGLVGEVGECADDEGAQQDEE